MATFPNLVVVYACACVCFCFGLENQKIVPLHRLIELFLAESFSIVGSLSYNINLDEKKKDEQAWKNLSELKFAKYEEKEIRVDQVMPHLLQWRLQEQESEKKKVESDASSNKDSTDINGYLFCHNRRLTDGALNHNNGVHSEQKRIFLNESHLYSLLTKANHIDPSFQASMRDLVQNLQQKNANLKIKFFSAPPKKLQRSREKTQVQYAHKDFPNSMELCDLIRCSIVCDSASGMFVAIKGVVGLIEAGKGGVIIQVLRTKNGAKIAYNFNGPEDATYWDYKINVLTVDKKAGFHMVGEVQFIHNSIFDAKRKLSLRFFFVLL